MKLYLNGIEVGSTSKTGTLNANTSVSAWIGSNPPTVGSNAFDGLIDEVRIYNRALSVEEIRYHYNRGGPVAHWKMDEGNGTTTYDSSGNGNDGYFGSTTTSPTWTTGKHGNALSFDGTDDYVDAGDSADVGVSDFTIEAWVRPSRVTSYKFIVSKGHSDGSVQGLSGANP